jgi:hypothetical protein
MGTHSSCVSMTRCTMGMSAPGTLYTVISPTRRGALGEKVRNSKSPLWNAGSIDPLWNGNGWIEGRVGQVSHPSLSTRTTGEGTVLQLAHLRTTTMGDSVLVRMLSAFHIMSALETTLAKLSAWSKIYRRHNVNRKHPKHRSRDGYTDMPYAQAAQRCQLAGEHVGVSSVMR